MTPDCQCRPQHPPHHRSGGGCSWSGFSFRNQLFLAILTAQAFRNTEINLRQLQRTANYSNQLWFDTSRFFFHCDG